MSTKRIVVFSVVQVFAAGLAWISGYDFDARGGWVAYMIFLSVAAGLILAQFSD